MNGNKHIGFTCSTFDLLHAGHIAMSQRSKRALRLFDSRFTNHLLLIDPAKNPTVQTLVERYTQLKAVSYVDEIVPSN